MKLACCVWAKSPFRDLLRILKFVSSLLIFTLIIHTYFCIFLIINDSSRWEYKYSRHLTSWKHYYMANPFLRKSLCSDWFFLGQVSTVSQVSTDRFHRNGPIRAFLFWSKAGKFNICDQDSEKKVWKLSFFTYQQQLKRLKFFRNFKDGWRRRTLFKCKPPEVQFTIRNRVPYNKLLTNQACSGRTGEY